eukprot:6465569-Amphidinium_carterae.1
MVWRIHRCLRSQISNTLRSCLGLADRPLELGRYKPYPAPIRSLCFHTQCCARPLALVRVEADGRDLGCSGNDGRIKLPSSRKEQVALVMRDVPAVLLPGENFAFFTVWKVPAPEQVEEEQSIMVNCMVWIYAIIEACDADDGSSFAEPPAVSVWVSVNAEHIPEEALPVHGQLLCPWGSDRVTYLDGTIMGPFPRPPLPPRLEEVDRCLLSSMELDLEPPNFYKYVPSDPNPLEERCNELGGCEFQRLLKVPCVIGHFYPFPTPQRSLHFLTQCCRTSIEGVHVKADGIDAGTSDVDGLVQLPKSRAARCSIRLGQVPLALLPGECGRVETSWELPGETAAECKELLVHYHVWVYAVAPDSPDEAVAESLETTIWMAVDPDHIPVEAKPVRGELTLPWMKVSKVYLDGKTFGPFPAAKSESILAAGDHCPLSRIAL